MAAFARAVFLRIYLASNGSTVRRWQNYYANEIVNGHEFMPFASSGVEVDDSGSQETMTITLPGFQQVESLTRAAMTGSHLFDATIYQFDQATTASALPGTETEVGSFLGNLINASSDFDTYTWTIGNPLSDLRANVPGLSLTTSLIGIPMRL